MDYPSLIEDLTNTAFLGRVQAHYDSITKDATENLMEFLKDLGGKNEIAVTYIDEADELQGLLWILLRQLHHQNARTSMCYVVMATKSSVSRFVPSLKDCKFFSLQAPKKP